MAMLGGRAVAQPAPANPAVRSSGVLGLPGLAVSAVLVLLAATTLERAAAAGDVAAEVTAPDPSIKPGTESGFDAHHFAVWLDLLRTEAQAKGISPSTFDRSLENVLPLPEVLERDRRQPEFTLTFSDYLRRTVTLERVRARYGVQPRFLVAFWGLESNYGDHTGGFSVIPALVTLAYDERRAAFFREQLMHALTILEQGHISLPAMSGSWAGAMGQLQFMPSTFTGYAVDGNGDGRRDIWTALPDIFTSAANFLASEGWQGTQTWGREVRLPADFDWRTAGLETRLPIAEWQAAGVRRADGTDLPRADMTGSIIIPSGHLGPAFLVYDNFRTTLVWNRSILYAVAIGHLADRIAGKGPMVTAAGFSETPMSRGDIERLQTRLNALGYDAGPPDGRAGRRTRAALKAFQSDRGLPADGHPSHQALAILIEAGPCTTCKDVAPLEESNAKE
jgi:membrane-bound lytic murein transglycosylase B